jgi:hypothetical protein
MFQVIAYTLVGLASAGVFFALGRWHARRQTRLPYPWEMRRWRDADEHEAGY